MIVPRCRQLQLKFVHPIRMRIAREYRPVLLSSSDLLHVGLASRLPRLCHPQVVQTEDGEEDTPGLDQ